MIFFSGLSGILIDILRFTEKEKKANKCDDHEGFNFFFCLTFLFPCALELLILEKNYFPRHDLI